MRSGIEEAKPIGQRFWERVNIKGPDDCWEWTKSRFHSGYGMFYPGNRRKVYAHRWAMLGSSALEPADREKLVLHKCNNKLCCNPAHLYFGNDSDNRRKYFEDGNRGTKFGSGCLSYDDVVTIRALRASGWRIVDIAKKFNYNRYSLRHVITGKSYAPHYYGT